MNESLKSLDDFISNFQTKLITKSGVVDFDRVQEDLLVPNTLVNKVKGINAKDYSFFFF